MSRLNVVLEVAQIRSRVIPMDRNEVDRAAGTVAHEFAEPSQSHRATTVCDRWCPELDGASIRLHVLLVASRRYRRNDI